MWRISSCSFDFYLNQFRLNYSQIVHSNLGNEHKLCTLPIWHIWYMSHRITYTNHIYEARVAIHSKVWNCQAQVNWWWSQDEKNGNEYRNYENKWNALMMNTNMNIEHMRSCTNTELRISKFKIMWKKKIFSIQMSWKTEWKWIFCKNYGHSSFCVKNFCYQHVVRFRWHNIAWCFNQALVLW